MTLKDLTLVMNGNEKIVLEYKAETIFNDDVDELYNSYIRYQGAEIDTTYFLEKVVSHVYRSNLYNAIYIEIED